MTSTEPPFDPQRHSDLVQLRDEVAGMIKDLVAARANVDPDWCVDENIDQLWFFSTRRPRSRSVIYLLEHSARGFRQYFNDYRGPLDSVPCEDEGAKSLASSVEQLKDLLCQFVDPEELTLAADQLRRKANPNWDLLANWRLLPQLRDLLDDLPEHSDQQLSKVGNEQLSVDVDGVHFQGLRLNCPPRVRNFLRYILQQPNYSCHIQELAGPIWKDREVPVTSQMAYDICKVTKKWFGKNKIPFNAHTGESKVLLVEEPLESSE